MSNLFVLAGNVLLTPDLSRCGVAGVTRERVLDAAHRSGVTCRVTPISREALLAATEAILVNSLIGAWSIRQLGATTWEPGAMIAAVRRWLDEDDA
jgi:4-amino-4-deoxychorismate lyase